jgi:hypothetical protein
MRPGHLARRPRRRTPSWRSSTSCGGGSSRRDRSIARSSSRTSSRTGGTPPGNAGSRSGRPRWPRPRSRPLWGVRSEARPGHPRRGGGWISHPRGGSGGAPAARRARPGAPSRVKAGLRGVVRPMRGGRPASLGAPPECVRNQNRIRHPARLTGFTPILPSCPRSPHRGRGAPRGAREESAPTDGGGRGSEDAGRSLHGGASRPTPVSPGENSPAT